MLKSWCIENFKPIISSGSLEFKPVTVLSGRNSSGKSSLLQSILMISQTLSNQSPERALITSDRTVPLGTFEEILNQNSKNGSLSVEFDLDVSNEDFTKKLNSYINIKTVKVSAVFNRNENKNIKNFRYDVSEACIEKILISIVFQNSGPIFPTLDNFYRFNKQYQKILTQKARETEVLFEIKKMSDADTKEFSTKLKGTGLDLITSQYQDALYNVILKDNLSTTVEHYYCTLSHFLPSRFYRKYQLRDRIPQITNSLLNFPSNTQKREIENLIDITQKLDDNTKKAITEVIEKKRKVTQFQGQTLSDLIIWFTSNSPKWEPKGGFKKNLIEKIKTILTQYLEQSYTGLQGIEAVNNNFLIDILDIAIKRVVNFFTRQVRHLEPLRSDPNEFKLPPNGEFDDIGSKGEFSAFVYDRYRNKNVKWYKPETLYENSVQDTTLEEALTFWVQYLDIANEVKTHIDARSGISSWQIINYKGQTALPLRSVGVGVSQILPILVMGLLATKNSLLIIEQPELHLHPSTQSRLGDFFMSLAKNNIYLLIETHSENLIKQLRLHIVEAGGLDNSNCMIYFAKNDEETGTIFEKIDITPKGRIRNWPRGFFDESIRQEESIVKAGLKLG